MYVSPNFKSKKAFREALKAGQTITVFSPGPFPPKENGLESIEGPHYPAPHTWYAQVQVEHGKVTKIIVTKP